jgi:hypothetical protein
MERSNHCPDSLEVVINSIIPLIYHPNLSLPDKIVAAARVNSVDDDPETFSGKIYQCVLLPEFIPR